MNAAGIGEALERLAATSGTRLVIAASIGDGLVVHAAGESNADADAIAALFGSIFRSAESAAAAHGRGRPRMLTVRAGDAQVLVAGAGELVLVLVGRSGANVGRMRLELLRAAEVVK